MWTMSHTYEIKLLYFLLPAAAILQNWADGHENHFLIVIAFLSICAESCLRISKNFLKMSLWLKNLVYLRIEWIL